MPGLFLCRNQKNNKNTAQKPCYPKTKSRSLGLCLFLLVA